MPIFEIKSNVIQIIIIYLLYLLKFNLIRLHLLNFLFENGHHI